MAYVAAPKDAIALDNVQIDRSYELTELSKSLTAKAESLVGKRIGQCVMALRQHFGIPYSEIRGYAGSNKPNSKTGEVGAVVIFKLMSQYGHVAIIIGDKGDQWEIFHSNMDWTGTGQIDLISKTDSKITGYKIIR